MSGMEIDELQPNSQVSILAIAGKKRIEMSVTVANVSDEDKAEIKRQITKPCVVLEVVTREYNKKIAIISFQSINANLSLLVVQEDKIYRWDNIKVEMLTLSSGKKYHVAVVNSTSGTAHNRRKGVRLNIDTRMNIEQAGNITSVIVRDVSYCGFSFWELEEDAVIDPEKPLILHITDSYGNIYGYITGKVVRTRVVEGGKQIHYGCKVNQEHHDQLQKYIAIKQVERVRGRGKKPKDLVKNENHSEWKQSIIYQMSRKK